MKPNCTGSVSCYCRTICHSLVNNYLSSKSSVHSVNLFQEAKEAKLLEEAMTTVPEMDDDGNDDSPPVDPSQLQGMTLQELKQHRRLLKKGLKVRL